MLQGRWQKGPQLFHMWEWSGSEALPRTVDYLSITKECKITRKSSVFGIFHWHRKLYIYIQWYWMGKLYSFKGTILYLSLICVTSLFFILIWSVAFMNLCKDKLCSNRFLLYLAVIELCWTDRQRHWRKIGVFQHTLET